MTTEQAKITVSAKEWWSYEWGCAVEAWSNLGWASFLRSLSGAVISLIGQYLAGLKTAHDARLMVWLTVGSGAIVFAGEFLISLLLAPAKLHKKAIMEAERARAEVTELKKEKDAKPSLEISRDSPEQMRFVPGGPSGQIKVAVTNKSKTETVCNVELEVMSVTPHDAPHCKFPSRAALPAEPRKIIKYLIEELHPTESESFAVLNFLSNTFSLNTENPNNNTATIEVAKYGKVSIQLKAKAKNMMPVKAVLTMTGDLKEMKFTVSLDS